MVSTSFVTLVFLVCLQTVLLSTVSNCAKTITMYWNTTNSIFRIDNTDHIIDVNKNNAAFEYDQVNIICPVYPSDSYVDDDAEKYIIYNVSKEEYDTCRITNPSPRIIAQCDKPRRTMYFTITFRPFTPQPGGLEFLPGHDYYFISTSSKDDLHRRIGGRCTSHNMKVVFKVCCSNDAETSSSSATSRNNSMTVTSSTVPSSSSTSTAVVGGGAAGVPSQPLPPSVIRHDENRYYPVESINGHRNQQSATAEPTLSHVPPPVYPGHPHQPQQPIHNGLPSSITPPKTSTDQKKKNKEYSDHPNEVVKNEELTYNSASSYGSQIRYAQSLILATISLLISTLLQQLLR
ncbi:ephrin-B2 [Pseudomyrmex gracilis]|uniref:ephrin-B2 n=1 Tax=Pseudomyrmex gracilis TaxID=219809 RepID=UPI0009958463|nr:ephrin-B2 [Pseudomyrmex gracilis]XP_020294833.1 ephrin-B2 [Pseudomyrmex gracilis]